MPVSAHAFQAPKGTRDFLPPEMAVRRHLEAVWRRTSIDHGFEEMDGPTFEHLDLYTVKSGEGIVSELFSFRRAGGDTTYALRPEFTPTLARMIAARGASLPMPVKWFAIPAMFRAERPQRGRLREHLQWNADLVGDAGPRADAEIVALTVSVLDRLGLRPEHVQVWISHRQYLETTLVGFGVDAERVEPAFALVDAIEKLPADEFRTRALDLGVAADRWDEFLALMHVQRQAAAAAATEGLSEVGPLHEELARRDLLEWCTYVPALARGLAYYTGSVFEVRETSGRERAIAGGGRYDQLVELFGGAPTPAVGIAMGDVVLRLVLEERGLLDEPERYLPAPDAFVISAGTDAAEALLPRLVADLRRGGETRRPLHVRHTYRATRHVGKLLSEASRCRARFAVILGREL
ncbi:MAG: histidine--tRNA ligase, partial [Planctomycetota bacterium]